MGICRINDAARAKYVTRLILGGFLSITLPVCAFADVSCKSAGPIAPELAKLVRDFQTASQTGHGSLPVREFLVGVSDIAAPDQLALDRRGLVELDRTASDAGSVLNDGGTALDFQGIFAGEQTFFRVPKHIAARYAVSGDRLTLNYGSAGALQFGEAIPLVNIPLYRTLDHVEVTPRKLLFFWTGNTSAVPDRCYVAD